MNWDVSQIFPVEDLQDNNDSDDNDPEPDIPMDINFDKCPHCLCRPCITSECFSQGWWASESERPCRRSNGLR